jgi:hypothetical protein
MSVLKNLFYGDNIPSEHIIPANAEYQSNNKKILEEMDRWQHNLSKEEFKKLESLYDLWSASSAMVEERSFMYGFRLGCLLIIEVYGSEINNL